MNIIRSDWPIAFHAILKYAKSPQRSFRLLQSCQVGLQYLVEPWSGLGRALGEVCTGVPNVEHGKQLCTVRYST